MTKDELEAERDRLAEDLYLTYSALQRLYPSHAFEAFKAGWDSAMEHMPKWMPVSEGLPEDDDNYQLSSFGERGNGCQTGYAIGGRANEGWFCAFTGKRITANIVAWMPLPEPYKP